MGYVHHAHVALKFFIQLTCLLPWRNVLTDIFIVGHCFSLSQCKYDNNYSSLTVN